MLPHFSYIRPETGSEAMSQLSDPESFVLAGGTDLLGCLRERIFPVRKLVSINGLAQFHGITETEDGGVRIGALTTITEVETHPLIQNRFPGLARGASEVASPQLRNQGTIGGNLCQKPRCWYYRGEFDCLRKGGSQCFAAEGQNQFHCIFGGDGICFIVHPSDTAPPLIALNASAVIAGPKGKKRQVPLEKFHVLPADDLHKETVLNPDEMVTEILIPPPPPRTRSTYRKVRARRAWDFSLAGVALAVHIEDNKVVNSRVVLSGAAPVPWRSKAVEDVIQDRELNSKTIADAAQAVVEGAEPLEHNQYKLPLFQGVMEEELLALTNQA
ncbi:MAG: xanthine dehydrogenase family protein subunit M [Deltaproteobacteria bacterium]|nr:xanthine dehydrogenase family protein subunit M [Deltaproteobacteria bacterium]